MKIPIFISYSHMDDVFRQELEAHLKILQRQELIDKWSDNRIAPGSNWEEEINLNLKSAKIILLLISSDFLDSDYCYESETIFALERHENGLAIVIPIILRPCLWQISSFKHLQVLPADGQPVSLWSDKDSAWLDIAKKLHAIIIELITEGTQERENVLQITKEIKNKLNALEKEKIFLLDQLNLLKSHTKEREHKAIVENLINQYNLESQPKFRSHGPRMRGQTKIEQYINSSEQKEYDLIMILYQFLRAFNEWYFSPLRIQKWGSQQPYFQELAKYDSKLIEKHLDSMQKIGIVKSTKSKLGNPIYRLDSNG